MTQISKAIKTVERRYERLEKRLKKLEKQSSFETTLLKVFQGMMIYMVPLHFLAAVINEYFPTSSPEYDFQSSRTAFC